MTKRIKFFPLNTFVILPSDTLDWRNKIINLNEWMLIKFTLNWLPPLSRLYGRFCRLREFRIEMNKWNS